MANSKIIQFVRKHRVLLIEDDDLVRRGLALALISNGFVVHAVSTAEEAIQVVGCKRFHSIICDYNLPGINGLEFFIRAKNHTARCTNVLITAYGFDQIYNNAVSTGIDAFFEKPFAIHALITLLNSGGKNPAKPLANDTNHSGSSVL